MEVRLSVDECIQEGVLADFLSAQRAEVIAMSIFEYNEEIELKKIREDEYSLGLEAGRAEGIRCLVECCLEHGDTEEAAASALSRKYSVSLEKAREYVSRIYAECK